VSGYAFHVYPIIRALREYDLVKNASVICTLDYIDLLHSDTPVDDLKGIAFTAPLCEIPGRVPGYTAWRSEFVRRFGKNPSYVDAYAYDTGRIVAMSLKSTGKVDADGIRKMLPFDGIVGRIELDQERDLKSTLVVGFLDEHGNVQEFALEQ
jgi:ABC-type branched-subunit amino acid transport system substrate-binding protein